MDVPSLWALRNARRVVASFRGERLPHCDTLRDLERLLRLRVKELAGEQVRRHFMVMRIVMLTASFWAAGAAWMITLVVARQSELAMNMAGWAALFGLGGPIGWGILSFDGMLSDRCERAMSTRDTLGGRELLAPFGGVTSLPMRLIHDAPSIQNLEPDTIGMEVAWWWCQLHERQRQVLMLQGSSDTTAGDVLDAFERCQALEE